MSVLRNRGRIRSRNLVRGILAPISRWLDGAAHWRLLWRLAGYVVDERGKIAP